MNGKRTCLTCFLKVLQIIVASLLLPVMAFTELTPKVVLEAKCVSVQKRKDGAGNLVYSVVLAATIKNVGNQPVIIYKGIPHVDGVTIATSKQKALASDFIYNQSAGLGKSNSSKLHKRMDKNSPPLDEFVLLAPNKTTPFELHTFYYFTKDPVTLDAGGQIKLISPLWLKIAINIWPNSVELRSDGSSSFGEMLRLRWKKYGDLLLDRIESEPIEVTYKH
jgi:hypothetical protein